MMQINAKEAIFILVVSGIITMLHASYLLTNFNLNLTSAFDNKKIIPSNLQYLFTVNLTDGNKAALYTIPADFDSNKSPDDVEAESLNLKPYGIGIISHYLSKVHPSKWFLAQFIDIPFVEYDIHLANTTKTNLTDSQSFSIDENGESETIVSPGAVPTYLKVKDEFGKEFTIDENETSMILEDIDIDEVSNKIHSLKISLVFRNGVAIQKFDASGNEQGYANGYFYFKVTPRSILSITVFWCLMTYGIFVLYNFLFSKKD